MLDKMKDMLGMKTASKDKELSHRDIMLKEKKSNTKNVCLSLDRLSGEMRKQEKSLAKTILI